MQDVDARPPPWVAFVVGVWLLALVALLASAHEGDSDQTSVLVLQAIGIIVNKPDDMDEIGDKPMTR